MSGTCFSSSIKIKINRYKASLSNPDFPYYSFFFFWSTPLPLLAQISAIMAWWRRRWGKEGGGRGLYMWLIVILYSINILFVVALFSSSFFFSNSPVCIPSTRQPNHPMWLSKIPREIPRVGIVVAETEEAHFLVRFDWAPCLCNNIF